MQGTRASVALVLTSFAWNILVTTPEGGHKKRTWWWGTCQHHCKHLIFLVCVFSTWRRKGVSSFRPVYTYASLNLTIIGSDNRADSRLAPSQWEMSLQSNAVSHWLGPNLESALRWYLTTCLGARSFPQPMLNSCQLNPLEQTSAKFESKCNKNAIKLLSRNFDRKLVVRTSLF